MEQKDSYLSKLRFDPKLYNLLISKYLLNFRYVLLLIIAIFAAGIFSFLNLPRRLNPEVKIPIVSVSTVFPGASPEDVESLVTVPIEDEIAGLENVNTITSSSNDSFSIVSVEFRSGVDPEDAKDNVQSAVDTIGDLPEEAQDPQVQKLDFENQPVWTFIVTGTESEASLMAFSENLKDRLEQIPSIKTVQISGREEEEVLISVNPNTARNFGIDPQMLSQAVQASLKSQPAGSLQTNSNTFSLTIDPTTRSVEDLRNIHINLGNQVVRLSDVAKIIVRSKPNQAKTYFASENSKAQRSVSFSVFKTESQNIDKATKDAQQEAEKVLTQNGNKFKLLTVLDLSNEVNKQFNDLLSSFRDTIFLVIIVLFIFLGVRQALIVAFSIPLSFLVAFTVMNMVGLTLNFLSLFSLILALGLLVDDAIVVVSAVTAYWRVRKFTPNETGLLVLRDFLVPIWSTTITAVWAFLPLLVASGIIGEFIKSISVVVSTTLIASTAIAILITLPLMMVFLKPKFPRRVTILLGLLLGLSIVLLVALVTLKSPLLPLNIVVTILLLVVAFTLRGELSREIEKQSSKFIDTYAWKAKLGRVADQGLFDSTKFSLSYQRLIHRVLDSKTARLKTLIVVIVFALFSYSLVPLGFVTNEFFPKADQTNLYVTVELPPGTNLSVAESEAKTLLEEFRHTKETEYVTADIARTISTEDFFGPTQATNNILFTFVLPEKEEREKTSIDIAQELRKKYKDYNAGKLSVVELSGGPPAGSDLQIKLLGEDLPTLDSYANRVMEYLEQQPNVSNVQKSLKSSTGKIVFVPDKLKMAQVGLTETTLGFQLRTYSSGFTLDKDVNLDGLEKDITFRTSEKLQSPETLGSANIKTQFGDFPLSSLGTIKLEPTSTQITREDQKRTISVSAAVSSTKEVTKENANLQDFVNSLNLPSGYETKTGGVNEENQQSVNSIFQAMIIAFILITATMVLQFGSFRKAFIILLKIPLAISGVFIVFALTQTPLSFPTLIGILALFGITVYHSMLIVDKIGKNEKAGMNLKHAISDGAASRVEPILFGTITTVVGLIPITLSDPLWRGLGGAIIAGLLFSGLLMLLFIPVVYYKFYEKEVK